MSSGIRTRIFIISDTHGHDWTAPSSCSADVAIHCGDLTDGSKIDEFRSAIRLLKSIDAPVKLAIAGNHDFTLDPAAFTRIIADSNLATESELVEKEFGTRGEVRQLFEDAKSSGMILLDEGNHDIPLPNGAMLKIYATPFTPGNGGWGFQYPLNTTHDFDIADGTSIVVSHGPPRGIFDTNHERQRAGCPTLFKAVAGVRPLIHAFGHIHEGWGAKLVAWKQELLDGDITEPSHFNAIDNNNSRSIVSLAATKPSRFDDKEAVRAKAEEQARRSQDGYLMINWATGDGRGVARGTETLFVNAAIEGVNGELSQSPFCVEVDLPRR